MAKFKVGDRVAYYGKDPAIYRKRGRVSDVSQIRGETFVTVDLDDGEEWGAPEKDWTFMNSCTRNAKFKVGDRVRIIGGGVETIARVYPKGRGTGLGPQEVDFYATRESGGFITDEDISGVANSCRSTNAVVAKALNACGTARNANFSTQDITKQLKELSLKMTEVRADYNKVKASDRLIKKSLSALRETIYDNADKITAGDKNAWDPMFREIHDNSPFGPM